jgi:hypothetical protein
MLTDMNVSKDTQNNFSQWMRNNEINLGMDCSVTVLTTGFWPTYKVDEVALPNELVKCVDKFTQFYESRTSHRKLKWIHTLGTCVVVGRFDAKPIDLVISTYQACILMLFNQQQEYTAADVASATKLPMEELKKYLQTLALSKYVGLSCLGSRAFCGACGLRQSVLSSWERRHRACTTFAGSLAKIVSNVCRYQVLTKTPKSKETADTDVFAFNNKFTDRQRKIKMSLLVTKVRRQTPSYILCVHVKWT